jgi:trypsin
MTMTKTRRRSANRFLVCSANAWILGFSSFAVCQEIPKTKHDSRHAFQKQRILPFLADTDKEDRIVGGTAVAKGTYPFYATTSGGQKLCGGTLIWPDIIMTAAHCGDIWLGGARIGGTLLNGTDVDTNATVTETVMHPSFTARPPTNDIMLVKLNNTIFETEGATLNYNDDIPAAGDDLSVIGFGFTSENGENSDILLTTTVDAFSFSACNDVYGVIDDEVMICAGTDTGGRDSCNGDSGGPLFTSSGEQIGITSFASGCAQPGVPAVYTRVSGFIEWILETICTLSSVPPDECDTPGSTSPIVLGVTLPPVAPILQPPIGGNRPPASQPPAPVMLPTIDPPVLLPIINRPPVLLPTIIRPPTSLSSESPVPSFVVTSTSSPSPSSDFGKLGILIKS